MIHPNKSPLTFRNISEKRESGRIQELPKFIEYPHIISGTGKATNFKFGRSTFTGSIRIKAY